MSYSFTASAADKKTLKEIIKAQLGEIVRLQPDHTLDRAAVQNAVFGVIDAMETPVKGDEITADLSGTVNYTKRVEGEGDQQTVVSELRGASIRLNVHFSKRAPS